MSTTTQLNDPIRHSPQIVIYDPRSRIRNPTRRLIVFASFVQICREEGQLIERIENAGDAQLILLLILPGRDHFETRAFLNRFIPDQVHLHSLYLIFSNGTQFHNTWINTPSMSKLCWCRSHTNRIIKDVLDFCEAACNAMIAFYRQQMIIAQDAVGRGLNNNSRSLVGLYANECRKFSVILRDYLLREN